jgi:PAS domain S-box-containing protein
MNPTHNTLQAELINANSMLRTVIDENPNIILMKDWDGKFLIGNRALANLYGTTPEELIGKDDGAFNPNKKQVAFYLNNIREVMSQSETQIVMEESTNAKTGEISYYQSIKKPITNADGDKQILVIANDVTELKQTQQRLEESERRLNYVLAATQEGIWDWDVQLDTVTHNLQWCQITGLTDGFLTHPLADFTALLYEEDKNLVLQRIHACLFDGERYQSEHRMYSKDKKVIWVLDRGDVVERDAEGNPLRLVGSMVDITDRKHAELALAERTELLKAIFNLSPDGFISFDALRRVTYVSPAFTQMTDIASAQLIGKSEREVSEKLSSICQPISRFCGVQALREHAVDGQLDKREIIELSLVGNRIIEVGIRLNEAAAVSQILYFRDVTHETEVDRMKSEFLSTAAHELRTPMASIYGYTELLLSQSFSETESREFLSTIFSQAGLMVTIINELLDLARIEARQGKDFNLERLNVGDLLNGVLKIFNVPASRDIPLLNINPEPIWVQADRIKMAQAINNILANAYKYSPNGGSVSIELIDQSVISDDGRASSVGRVGIRVSDNGIGMTSEQEARVFERFYRADTSGNIPGTGLGMSIVKEIVEFHGGNVTISSSLGKGTVVTIWLPVEIVEANNPV